MARLRIPAIFLVLALTASGACKENTGVRVSSFTFKGNKAVKSGQLKSVLATAASSKLPWGAKRYFSREQFEADLKRIVAFYTDRGYPEARVTSFDAKLNDAQDAVAITVNISEGEPVTVERIELTGFDPLPEDHRQTLDGKMPLKVGAPLDRAVLQASREAALDELRDHGHPYAAVRVVESPGTSERKRTITLRGDPGPIAEVGEIEISGNATVSENVIRRQLTFRPGSLFRQSRLQESQSKLYGLELFQFANIEPIGVEAKPVIVPVRVTVTKSNHKKVNFGIGYGSEEKARTEIDWRHVNAFGGAQTIGVLARYSSLDRGVRLNYKEPYIFTPRWSMGVSGQLWQTREPAYDLDTTGGRVTFTRQFARRGGAMLATRPSMALSFTYANEWESYEIDPDILEDVTLRDELIALGLDPESRGRTSGQRGALSVDMSRNSTDNLLDAKRGYVVSLHLEQAAPWLGGTFDYREVTAEGRLYRMLGNRAVVAGQARFGNITATGDPTVRVPFYKRYFLGGATNLRGWGRFEVAPLSEGGLPIGGTRYANASLEIRAPLWGNLSGVAFVDAGTVWADPDRLIGEHIGWRYDVGPGLRYQTPIGPLRVDFGYQVNPIPNLFEATGEKQRRFRFHFSIGQAF